MCIRDRYESACLMRAQELMALGRPLDALPILRRIEDNKTAKKRLEMCIRDRHETPQTTKMSVKKREEKTVYRVYREAINQVGKPRTSGS